MTRDVSGFDLYWQYRKGEKTLRELSHLYRIHSSVLSHQFRQRDDRMLRMYGPKWFLEILRLAMPEDYDIVCEHVTEHNLTRVQTLAELGCTVSTYYQEKRKDPVKFLRKKVSQKRQLSTRPTRQLSQQPIL
ncbi:hypothetical protein AUG19_08935 [archaeon 13_1_20CM_2_54_9]|nr:MAG: hypothetical protein AUG19_08935 [archaeon 13_1_20CM_2_54_9]